MLRDRYTLAESSAEAVRANFEAEAEGGTNFGCRSTNQ